MTDQAVEALYTDLMYSGKQTLEKHIRHAAEQLVSEIEGGFKDGPSRQDRFSVPWHTYRGYRDVNIYAPPGMHGFALQMVVEAQLREQLA